MSIVSWMEVMVGAPEGLAEETRLFLSRFRIVGLDQEVAEIAVDVRRTHRIKLPDALVWACAKREGRLLVTRDVKAFPADDPGIRIPYAPSA